jgi:hypothetical protein
MQESSSAHRGRRWRGLVGALVMLGCGSMVARAQQAPRLDLGGVIEPGSETERYLRILQTLGDAPMRSWSIQPFADRESRSLVRMIDHPWRAQFVDTAAMHLGPFRVLRSDARVQLNTGFPTRDLESPAWYGRGLNAQWQGGVVATFGRLRVQLAPLVWVSQNSAFKLAPTTYLYGDPRNGNNTGNNIDLPQRFGDGPTGRIDLGSSAIQLDLPGVYLALSNEQQRWGPGRTYALVLSPNPGGFPHFAIGTSKPVNIGIGSVHMRYVAGRLDQTAYMVPTDHPVRLETGAVFSYSPAFFEGLEIGAIKVSEQWMPRNLDFESLARPFTGIFNHPGAGAANLNLPSENGMASAFFRWTMPKSGLDLFGELYREDFNLDFRALLAKPDDLAGYMLGMQYATPPSNDRIRVVRVEVANGQLAQQEKGQHGFSPDYDFALYIHGFLYQGHTQRGQLLGAPDVYGGAGMRLAFEEFTPQGRRSITFQRSLQAQAIPVVTVTGVPTRPADVLYSLRFEQMRFRGARDYTVAVIPTYNLNRYTIANNDQFNLYLAFGIRGWR